MNAYANEPLTDCALFFQHDGCAPCHVIAPTVEDECRRSGLKLYSVDVAARPGTIIASNHGVKSTPWLVVYRAGRLVACGPVHGKAKVREAVE